MGLNQKNNRWEKNSENFRENQRCKGWKGELGECCKKHHWNLFGDILPMNARSLIITTEAADKFIKEHMLKRDENLKLIPSTERGKRRAAKRGK